MSAPSRAGARCGLIAAALASIAALTMPAAVAPASTGATATGGTATADFWTPERIERARPLELVRGGGDGPTLRRARQPPPFASTQVPDPTVPPLPTDGKLFGKLPGLGLFQCSATVLDTASGKVIFTAGHCVYDPGTGTPATRLSFVPAYTNGARPFGLWEWRRWETTKQWVRQANSNFDYAGIVLAPQGGAPIESVVGGRRMLVNGPRAITYHAFGYPENLGNGELLWTCDSGYAGDDPRPFPVGKPAIGMGCDMMTGASGGGWFNDAGRLVSVSSFGYFKRPGFLYGPYLTQKAAALVARLASR